MFPDLSRLPQISVVTPRTKDEKRMDSREKHCLRERSQEDAAEDAGQYEHPIYKINYNFLVRNYKAVRSKSKQFAVSSSPEIMQFQRLQTSLGTILLQFADDWAKKASKEQCGGYNCFIGDVEVANLPESAKKLLFVFHKTLTEGDEVSIRYPNPDPFVLKSNKRFVRYDSAREKLLLSEYFLTIKIASMGLSPQLLLGCELLHTTKQDSRNFSKLCITVISPPCLAARSHLCIPRERASCGDIRNFLRPTRFRLRV